MLRSILALAGLAVAAANASADYVTPDSILWPPQATYPGTEGTPVDRADWVTTQYSSLGLTFPTMAITPEIAYGTGVASVQGANVWSPLVSSFDGPGHSVSKLGFLAGFVEVGLTRPADSLAVDVVWAGTAEWFDVVAYTANNGCFSIQMEGGTGPRRISLAGGEAGGGFVSFVIS